MNTDKLQAGRELDATVANLLGWQSINNTNGSLTGIPPDTMNRTTRVEVSHFSTDGILTAWPVWEWLPRGRPNFALDVNLSDCPRWREYGRIYIVSAKMQGTTQYSGSADTPELAICRAALDAAEKGV